MRKLLLALLALTLIAGLVLSAGVLYAADKGKAGYDSAHRPPMPPGGSPLGTAPNPGPGFKLDKGKGNAGVSRPSVNPPAPPVVPPFNLGFVVAPLTPKLAEKLGLPSDKGGVVVLKVLPRKSGEKLLVQKGDVVIAAAGAPVRTPADLYKAAAEAEGSIVLTIIRQGAEMSVTVPLLPQPPLPQMPPPGPGPDHGAFWWFPFLNEFKDIPAGERFAHFLGAQFSLADKEGAPHTVKLFPGKVVEITELAITVLGNDGTTQTFAITDETVGKRALKLLKPNAPVIVVTLDASDVARAVLSPQMMKALGVEEIRPLR